MSTVNLTDEELLSRALEERAAVVAKYDKGREEGAQIDAWEDPAFELYHVTDRYGFIHDHRLPDKLTVHEAKVRDLDIDRLEKWNKMLRSWDKYYPGDKVKRRVYKGIPMRLRGEVWNRVLDIHRVKQEQEGMYNEMKRKSRTLSTEIRQIDLDVNRTYRNNIMFRMRYGPKQKELFNVLCAYSVYNSEVGYCQGMSQIAALLLMFMNEEEAFWALSVLMSDERHAMHGFFIPEFPKLKRFQEHHDKILGKFLPKLKKHLDKYDIHSSLYTLKWFFQCFLDRVPFTLTLRLWDIYVLEGEIVLTAMSYTLMKLHRKSMLKMSMDDLIEFLQIKLEQDFGYHDDAAVDALQSSMDELRKNKLHKPGRPAPNELPQKPFGLIPEPEEVNNQKLGNDSNSALVIVNGGKSPIWKHRDGLTNHHINNSHAKRDSKISDIVEDDGSSIVDPLSSRNSLAETSQTSAADLSALSGFSSPSTTLTRPGKASPILKRTLSLYDNVDYTDCLDASLPRTRSPDAVRIYVPYELSPTPTPSPPPHNGDVTPTNQDPNKITIHVDLQTDHPVTAT